MSTPVADPPPETADPSAVRGKLDSGDAALIDVRTPAEFRAVHAVGARNVPLDTFDPHAVAAEADGADLFVICKSGSRSTQAVRKLRAAGYDAVGVAGGTEAWDRDGLPVERGREVMSLERQVRIAAGALVFGGTLLGWFVHPACLALPAFVGAGLVFAGVTDTCGMGMLIAKMPWNRL